MYQTGEDRYMVSSCWRVTFFPYGPLYPKSAHSAYLCRGLCSLMQTAYAIMAQLLWKTDFCYRKYSRYNQRTVFKRSPKGRVSKR